MGPLDEGTPSPPTARVLSRRTALKAGGAVGAAVATLNLLELSAVTPVRAPLAEAATLPDIQFDIGDFIAPAQTINGVLVRFGPVFTVFLTGRLNRTPSRTDQQRLANALATIEASYAFSPAGLFTFVSYGLPYFRRLPLGLVAAAIPRLAGSLSRLALEEAVASPTDVAPANPGISKRRFNVPVRIESNDILFTFRSDSTAVINDVINWLEGSNRLNGRFVPSPTMTGLITVTSSRVMFQQIGTPRRVADQHGLGFRTVVNPQSPMWMGFADQQVNGSGPAAICTFKGNPSAHLTTAQPGDYFDNAAIQHLSHVIQDLDAFYDQTGNVSNEPETYLERVQYMFRSNPPPSQGNADQFTDGGGPAFLPNLFNGPGDAQANASGVGTPGGDHRLGHLSTLQRSSRAADGTPIHMRMDGPGFDSMDVPGGSNQPKLQFTVFVPTADFFTTMRRNQASLDLQQTFAVDPNDNGVERFITATRRQNFLIPPRRHRAFPLVEFT